MNEMEELRRLYESVEIPPEFPGMVAEALGQKENAVRSARPQCDASVLKSRGPEGFKAESETESLKTKREPENPMAGRKANGYGEDHKLENFKGKESKKQGEKTMNGKKKRIRRLSAAAAAFAVLIGAFGVSVSANEAFAASVSDIPVLGALARVFTGEQVDEADAVIHVEMTLPKVEGLTDKAAEERINQEIHDKMTAVVEEVKTRAAEEKTARLAAGGVEEEYMLREVLVDYEVKAVTEDVLSFLVAKTETGASAYYELYYYNIDLNANRELTLADLLGDDYRTLANEQIAAAIAVRSQNPEHVYFDGAEGVEGFTSIAADQAFYVNENGNPVVVFNKYEIAPGYMGIQEFEIVK